MARKNRNKEDRREQAVERQATADGRTPQEQLTRLDDMFGKGKGAQKERGRLAKRIAEPRVKKDENTDD